MAFSTQLLQIEPNALKPPFARTAPNPDTSRDFDPASVTMQVLQYLVDHSEGALSLASGQGLTRLAKAMMPGVSERVLDHNVPIVKNALLEFGLDHMDWAVMSFATILTETGGFQPLEEFVNWTGKANNSAYSPFDVYEPQPGYKNPASAEDFIKMKSDPRYADGIKRRTTKGLGDPERWPGKASSEEGAKYHGRGFVQLTHKKTYEDAGDALGADLVGNPNLLVTDPATSARAMAWFFTQDDKLAQISPALRSNNTHKLRSAVNGGLYGIETFEKSYWQGKSFLKQGLHLRTQRVGIGKRP